MINLLRYIHQNPLAAGLCSRVEDYKWSSDIYNRKRTKSFVNTSMMMKMFSTDSMDAITKYIEVMKEAETIDYDKQNIIGEEAYQVLCASRKTEVARKRLDEILIETGILLEDFKLVKQGSRKSKIY